tara:strand:- start:5 stop:217 length:213 start_codon:yes stop_codon:yes gene_type:complete
LANCSLKISNNFWRWQIRLPSTVFLAGDPLIKHDALADDDIAEKLSESVAKRLDGVEDSDAGAEDEGNDD